MTTDQLLFEILEKINHRKCDVFRIHATHGTNSLECEWKHIRMTRDEILEMMMLMPEFKLLYDNSERLCVTCKVDASSVAVVTYTFLTETLTVWVNE